MKILSSLFCMMVVSSFFFSGCKKKSDPPPPTRTDHITTGTWKYESGGADVDKNGTIDYQASAMLATCVLDNTIAFKTDNTGIGDEGATKCNGADAQTAPFNWNFADAEANLVISNNIFSILNGKFKIATLTATNFTLTKDTLMPAISPQPIALIVNLKQ